MWTAILVVIGFVSIIISTVLYFEYRFDKRLKMKKQYARHFLWLIRMGLRESAYIVYPELGSWRDIVI